MVTIPIRSLQASQSALANDVQAVWTGCVGGRGVYEHEAGNAHQSPMKCFNKERKHMLYLFPPLHIHPTV